MEFKFKGRNVHRLEDNPEEKRFALAWDKSNQFGRTLAYLLSTDQHRPPEPSKRDHEVAATVVQWLGSPVGRAFLEDLGYKKRT